MDDSAGLPVDAADGTGCANALADDLGWGLGMIFRAYVKAAHAAVADLPGGPRGYQILSAAAQGTVASQLALAQHLGVDRTVMTYLLDDLEAAGLIERRPDPADRRARRIVATEAGNELLSSLNDRLRAAEAHLLGPLGTETATRSAPRCSCWPRSSMRSTRPTARATWLTRWTPKYRLLANPFGQFDRTKAGGRQVAPVSGPGISYVSSQPSQEFLHRSTGRSVPGGVTFGLDTDCVG